MLVAERIFIGDKLDLISMFWEPAKEGAVPRARDLARGRRQGRVGVLGRGGGLFEQQAAS